MEEDFGPENLPNTFLSPLSISMFLNELNNARTNPQQFAGKIRELMKSFV